MMKRTAVVAAALCLLTIPSCKPRLDAKKIEKSIGSEFEAKDIKLRSITCPANVPIKQGDKFDCEASDSEGQSLVVHVEQTDNAGSISWKLDGMIINMQKVGDSIEAKVGQSADVKCPEMNMILRVNESFTCDATIAGGPHKVAITLTDSSGNVAWKVVK